MKFFAENAIQEEMKKRKEYLIDSISNLIDEEADSAAEAITTELTLPPEMTEGKSISEIALAIQGVESKIFARVKEITIEAILQECATDILLPKPDEEESVAEELSEATPTPPPSPDIPHSKVAESLSEAARTPGSPLASTEPSKPPQAESTIPEPPDIPIEEKDCTTESQDSPESQPTTASGISDDTRKAVIEDYDNKWTIAHIARRNKISEEEANAIILDEMDERDAREQHRQKVRQDREKEEEEKERARIEFRERHTLKYRKKGYTTEYIAEKTSSTVEQIEQVLKENPVKESNIQLDSTAIELIKAAASNGNTAEKISVLTNLRTEVIERHLNKKEKNEA